MPLKFWNVINDEKFKDTLEYKNLKKILEKLI